MMMIMTMTLVAVAEATWLRTAWTNDWWERQSGQLPTSRTTDHNASSQRSAKMHRALIERVVARPQTHRSWPLLSVLSPWPAPREISLRRQANNQSHAAPESSRQGSNWWTDGSDTVQLTNSECVVRLRDWRVRCCDETVRTVTSSLCKHSYRTVGKLPVTEHLIQFLTSALCILSSYSVISNLV